MLVWKEGRSGRIVDAGRIVARAILAIGIGDLFDAERALLDDLTRDGCNFQAESQLAVQLHGADRRLDLIETLKPGLGKDVDADASHDQKDRDGRGALDGVLVTQGKHVATIGPSKGCDTIS